MEEQRKPSPLCDVLSDKINKDYKGDYNIISLNFMVLDI